MTALVDLLGVDPLGFPCIPAGNLGAAFARADKPVMAPRTCATGFEPETPGALAALLRHDPDREEWVQFVMRRRHLWGEATFVAPRHGVCAPYIPDTPAPAAAVLLLSALLFVALLRRGVRHG
ncbi:hypothetical protein [Tropicimonas sp. IMCC34043]|uniref:hypothetical protein n=1 Tax=Tropicimonas sp. IMCC34043 TaxID=2248760 RepID=UPI000E27143C|nr:hypothetical protein [Tropicimonas sp. IMCC34043]